MPQLLHGSATTMLRTGQAFQQSTKPTAVLAQRYYVNSKTVRTWRRRSGAEDLPMGPKQPHTTELEL